MNHEFQLLKPSSGETLVAYCTCAQWLFIGRQAPDLEAAIEVCRLKWLEHWNKIFQPGEDTGAHDE